MRDATLHLRQLEACVQEELGAQGRALAGLEVQAAALRAGDPARIAASTREVELELGSARVRGQRREHAVRALGGIWSVDPGLLTLASIAERAAEQGARLGRLRSDLRRAAAAVARQVRRNALLARLHQRAWSEVLDGALAAAAGSSARSDESGGRLVDAQA